MIKRALDALPAGRLFGAVRGNPALSHVEAGLAAYHAGRHDGLDVERGGLNHVRHTSSIVDPLPVKVNGAELASMAAVTAPGSEIPRPRLPTTVYSGSY